MIVASYVNSLLLFFQSAHCGPGYFLNNTDPDYPTCVPCPLDFYKNDTTAATECYRCPDNRTTLSTGSDKETLCKYGLYLYYNTIHLWNVRLEKSIDKLYILQVNMFTFNVKFLDTYFYTLVWY